MTDKERRGWQDANAYLKAVSDREEQEAFFRLMPRGSAPLNDQEAATKELIGRKPDLMTKGKDVRAARLNESRQQHRPRR